MASNYTEFVWDFLQDILGGSGNIYLESWLSLHKEAKSRLNQVKSEK